jgi:hypothetical protein
MSAVAALAVASPFAVTAVSESMAQSAPVPEEHEFVQAAMITDLPGEIMSALQSTLSQFGIPIPTMPSIFGSNNTTTSTMMPGGLPNMGTPTVLPTMGMPSTPLTALNTPGLASVSDITNPALNSPVTTTTPEMVTTTTPGLVTTTTPAGTTTAPTGLFTPNVPTLTSPATGASNLTSEMPISASGADGLGGYPVMDPSLLAMPSTSAPASGGLVSAVSNLVSGGTSQVIDLLKGIIAMATTAAPAAAAAVPAAAVPAIS